jgi:hypothetical protein
MIVNFREWPLGQAITYVEPFEWIEEKVKPARMLQNRVRHRELWWIYGEHRPGLQRALAPLPFCFVTARVTKHLSWSRGQTDVIYTDKVDVLASARWGHFAVLQSTLHEVWARKYSGALKQDLSYTPSECFVTFAFPAELRAADLPLDGLGEKYHEYRRVLMLRLWLGLTDVYNLFHSTTVEADLNKHFAARAKKDTQGLEIPEEHRDAALEFTYGEALAGIIELRRLHVELDNAVLAAYGWHESGPMGPAINLAHDFYDVETLPENDRTRYTISPAARKELLARLLKENHARAAAEVASAPVPASKPAAKSRGKKKAAADDEGLFA